MGVILLLIPFINNLGQLYALFAIMSIGITLGTGPILTKIVSGWFHTRRELTLKLVSGVGSKGVSDPLAGRVSNPPLRMPVASPSDSGFSIAPES